VIGATSSRTNTSVFAWSRPNMTSISGVGSPAGGSPALICNPALNVSMAAPTPPLAYAAATSAETLWNVSRSGSSSKIGGSWATTTRTCSGCRPASSSAMSAPELLPNTAAGSLVTARSSRCASSACSSTRSGPGGPSSGLRELPRRS
jgi:hypothetical protein